MLLFSLKKQLWLVLILAFGLVLTTGCGLFTDDEVVEEEEELLIADFFNSVTIAFEKAFQSYIAAVEGWDDEEGEWILDEDKEIDLDTLWSYFDDGGLLYFDKEDFEEDYMEEMGNFLDMIYWQWAGNPNGNRDDFLEEDIEFTLNYKYFIEMETFFIGAAEDYPQEELQNYIFIAKLLVTVGDYEMEGPFMFQTTVAEYPTEFKLVVLMPQGE